MASGAASNDEVAAPHLIIEHARMLNNVQPYIAGTNAPGAPYNAVPAWSEYSEGMNVRDEINRVADEELTGINPYIGLSAYDPHPHLNKADVRYDLFADMVEGIDPKRDLVKATENAVTLADEQLFSTSQIDDAIDAHETRTEAGYQRRVSSALAPLLSGRAIMSSGFDDVVGNMAMQREAEIGAFAAELGLRQHDRRVEIVYNLIGSYMNMLQLRLTSSQAAVQLRSDLARQRILAGQDQINIDLDYDEKQNHYRLDLFHYETEVMASYRGATTVAGGQKKGERLLGTLGTAVTTGIGLGTVTKSMPIGIAGGVAAAVLGGVLGNWN